MNLEAPPTPRQAGQPGPHVATVLGPRPADSLGVVDAHDHLWIASPALEGGEIDDEVKVVEEVREARASGIGAIVELTPIGLGRRPEVLRRISETTGVAIIAATGYHRDAHYPGGHWVHREPVERLADRVIADLTVGMPTPDWMAGDSPPSDGTGRPGRGQVAGGRAGSGAIRAGVIKAGASYQRLTPDEERRLEACAAGSLAAGAAIVVHTEVGTCGHEIVDVLEAAGAGADRIVLAHLDRNPDLELHEELVGRGVRLVYDTIGRIKYRPDSQLLELIEAMVAAGHGDRLLVGLDLGVRGYFRSFGGGPGLRSLMGGFVPRLRRRIGDAATDAILIANPAAAYAIRPSVEPTGAAT
jgi:5-phospho-D-xylono-1,4-lactonase